MNTKGFTLIELLFAMFAIIAILSLSMPMMLSRLGQARHDAGLNQISIAISLVQSKAIRESAAYKLSSHTREDHTVELIAQPLIQTTEPQLTPELDETDMQGIGGSIDPVEASFNEEPYFADVPMSPWIVVQLPEGVSIIKDDNSESDALLELGEDDELSTLMQDTDSDSLDMGNPVSLVSLDNALTTDDLPIAIFLADGQILPLTPVRIQHKKSSPVYRLVLSDWIDAAQFEPILSQDELFDQESDFSEDAMQQNDPGMAQPADLRASPRGAP